MKGKLFYKILTMIIIPLVIVSSILSVTFYFTIRDEIISTKINEVSQMMVFVSQDLANSLYYLDVEKVDEIVNRISLTSGIMAVYVFDMENQLIATNLSEEQLSKTKVESKNVLENMLLSNEIQTQIQGDVLQVSHPIKISDRLGTLRIDWTLNELTIAVNNLLLMLIASMIGSSVVAVTVGVFMSRSITNPIKNLQNSIEKISKGDFDSKVDVKGRDEIASLALSFNSMASSLEEKIQIEQELAITKQHLKNEKMITMGTLSSRLAHDLRNPLSIIQVSLENLKLMYGADESKQRAMNKIDRSIDRIVHQVDDVLNFVKEKPVKLFKTNTTEIILESFDSLVIPSTIKINLPEHDVDIICDKKQLATALNNLILNGIQAVEKTGIIEIRIKENTASVIFEVEDSGLGIPKETIDHIFEPLFTTKQEGTGLGLVSVKSIVDAHGGTISVTSPPTIFTITLPKKPGS